VIASNRKLGPTVLAVSKDKSAVLLQQTGKEKRPLRNISVRAASHQYSAEAVPFVSAALITAEYTFLRKCFNIIFIWKKIDSNSRVALRSTKFMKELKYMLCVLIREGKCFASC